jgi:hypothetical protein
MEKQAQFARGYTFYALLFYRFLFHGMHFHFMLFLAFYAGIRCKEKEAMEKQCTTFRENEAKGTEFISDGSE